MKNITKSAHKTAVEIIKENIHKLVWMQRAVIVLMAVLVILFWSIRNMFVSYWVIVACFMALGVCEFAFIVLHRRTDVYIRRLRDILEYSNYSRN